MSAKCYLEHVNRAPDEHQSFPCEIRGSSRHVSSACGCMSGIDLERRSSTCFRDFRSPPGALTTVPCALSVRLLRRTREHLSAGRCDSAHHRETCHHSEKSQALALLGTPSSDSDQRRADLTALTGPDLRACGAEGKKTPRPVLGVPKCHACVSPPTPHPQGARRNVRHVLMKQRDVTDNATGVHRWARAAAP